MLAQLDYCNGVLTGLPASQLSWLQPVLHTAARLIYDIRRYDHVTPLLQQLHWLSARTSDFQTLRHGVSALNTSRRTSGSCPRFILASDCVRPPVYRRCGSCHTPVFTWRPRIPGRRSSSVERATAQCHIRTISVLIPATPVDIYITATTASITLITVSWSWSA